MSDRCPDWLRAVLVLMLCRRDLVSNVKMADVTEQGRISSRQNRDPVHLYQDLENGTGVLFSCVVFQKYKPKPASSAAIQPHISVSNLLIDQTRGDSFGRMATVLVQETVFLFPRNRAMCCV